MELANEYWRRQLGCKTEAKNQTLAQMSYDQLFEDLKNLRAQLENDKKKLTPVVRKLKLIDFLLKHVFVK
jgi:ABC-type transporter MlaC component